MLEVCNNAVEQQLHVHDALRGSWKKSHGPELVKRRGIISKGEDENPFDLLAERLSGSLQMDLGHFQW